MMENKRCDKHCLITNQQGKCSICEQEYLNKVVINSLKYSNYGAYSHKEEVTENIEDWCIKIQNLKEKYKTERK